MRALACGLLAAACLACSNPAEAQGAPAAARPRAQAKPRAATAPADAPLPKFVSEDELYDDAARVAWGYVKANMQPTGIALAVPSYGYATIWDIASSIAALYCARELDLIPRAEYDLHLGRALRTLQRVKLFDGIAFNKFYAVRTGTLVGRNQTPSQRGYGWSALDVGRLLIWLKIVAADPKHADAAAAVVKRLAADKLTRDGYMLGATLERSGLLRIYQEGRLGYEQYSARGYDLWGLPVANAIDLQRNATPITILGHELAADVRGKDRLTSEPFILAGLELGWAPDMRRLAEQVLAVQEERTRRTGHLTGLSEDAIGRAPHYFYYYCIYANGQEFVPDVQDPRAVVEEPRWVSTKAAFAWSVLLPGEYSRRLVDAVARARAPRGWGAGTYEGSGRSTSTPNINTEAVVLEAALYRKRGGRPLLEAGR